MGRRDTLGSAISPSPTSSSHVCSHCHFLVQTSAFLAWFLQSLWWALPAFGLVTFLSILLAAFTIQA